MRLLLADDERELSRALEAVLKHNNYSVDVVNNGADAMDYALSGNYDGLILDIMMPKKNGLEVVRELRERGIPTPVLLLTARAEIDQRIEGLDAGADDYLTKPFAMGELLARVRALTRRREIQMIWTGILQKMKRTQWSQKSQMYRQKNRHLMQQNMTGKDIMNVWVKIHLRVCIFMDRMSLELCFLWKLMMQKRMYWWI